MAFEWKFKGVKTLMAMAPDEGRSSPNSSNSTDVSTKDLIIAYEVINLLLSLFYLFLVIYLSATTEEESVG